MATGDTAKNRLVRAEELLLNGQFNEALQELQSAQQTDPDNEQIQSLKEKINVLKKEEDVMNRYMENQMYKNALGHINTILAKVNKCVRFKILKAECLAHLSEYYKAKELLIEIGGSQETEAIKMDMTYIKALIQFNEGDIKNALLTAKEGMDKNKSHPKVKQIFFRSRYLQNQLDEAERSVEMKSYQQAKSLYNEVVEAICEDNKSGEYNRVLAKILQCKAETSLKMKAYIDAIADFERIISYGELLDEAYASLADAHIATGGLDLAIRILKKSIDHTDMDEKTRVKIEAKLKEIEMKKVHQHLQHMQKRLGSCKTPRQVANLEEEASTEDVKRNLKELLEKNNPAQYANLTEDDKRIAEEVYQFLVQTKEKAEREEPRRAKLQELNATFEKMNSWRTPRQAAGLKDDAKKKDVEKAIKDMIKKFHADSFANFEPEDKQKADELVKKILEFQAMLKKEK